MVKERRQKRGVQGLVLALLVLFSACADPQPPEEFREAFDVLNKALSKERLEASSFAPRFPDPTAQQVVSYILSQAGAEVLQISGSPLAEDVDFLSDVPVWPSTVTLWHTSKQSYARQRQVILTWNDAEHTITASAFVGQDAEPVYVRKYTVVPLTPSKELDPSDTREFQAF